MSEERVYWLAWSKIPGVGPILIRRLVEHFGSLGDAWMAPAQSLGEVEGFGIKLIEKVTQKRSQIQTQELLNQHEEKNPHFWTPADADYPRLLLEIPNPPPVLYYQGEIKPQENQGMTPMIGIVGTREPTEHGKRWTRKISKMLASQGFTIVSGMAAGIDGVAHQACLDVGGRTIAVVGTGLDIVYPPRHRQLHGQIQQQGLIVSEYPVGIKPSKSNFPARNRIIAGLSRAILVMEAPERSGALITARLGAEFGRDVYILPNSPDVYQARGCLRLLHQGANIIVNEQELLTMLGGIPQLDQPVQLSLLLSPETIQKESIPQLEPRLAQVLEACAYEPISIDLIVQKVGLDTGAVSGALLELELLGLVSQLPGMRYQRYN